MPLSRLVDKSFAPEVLAVLYQAFDGAWAELSPRFGTAPERIEFGRAALAQALLSVAGPDANDPEQLKMAALEAFNTMDLKG